MTPKDQIIELLAAGVPTSQIAAAVGCSDSYVSQLKADPEVQTLLASKAVEITAKDIAFDTKLEAAETAALEKIERSLPMANFGQSLAAFRILNAARKRKDANIPVDHGGTTINVNLTLPATALPTYTLSARKELVEVDGKSMITATPKSLDQILLARAPAPLSTSIQLDRAAAMLEAIPMVAPKRQARRLPRELSEDVL